MISSLVCLDNYRLNVRDLPEESRRVLNEIAESGGSLYWDHFGQVRKVPLYVLRDTLRRLEDWEALAGRRGWERLGVPEFATSLYWDQTQPSIFASFRSRGLTPLRLQSES